MEGEVEEEEKGDEGGGGGRGGVEWGKGRKGEGRG